MRRNPIKREPPSDADQWRLRAERYQRLYHEAEDAGDHARAILAELVALKDGPRGEDYERRKPLAWQRARDLLHDK